MVFSAKQGSMMISVYIQLADDFVTTIKLPLDLRLVFPSMIKTVLR